MINPNNGTDGTYYIYHEKERFMAGKGNNPWRDFPEKYGTGAFNVCVSV